MRIGIDAHTLGSKSSGNESYYLQLLRELAKAPDAGDRYVIYFTLPNGKEKIPAASNFVTRRIRPASPYIRIPFSFPLEFRRERLDVFQAQYIIPPFCYSKTVATIHDILFESHPEFFAAAETFRFKILIRWSARRADHIVTLSQASKNDIVSHYRIDPEKISVIELAPRDEFRAMNPEECRELIQKRYGIREPFVLYVGRINPRKNLLRLIEAFSILRRKGVSHKLVIVGKQDLLAAQVSQRVKDLSLEDAVIFTGYADWDDVPVFYNAADLFVFPSICEGFGLPVVEAMACGVPVVTSYGSSLEEVAGGAAVLADPLSVDSIASAIYGALSDQDLRTSLRDRGLRRVKDFNAARQAQQTIAVYHKLAS
ncbi:MAG: glycosyltransferase family 4 protein [Terriglobales bacterium]